MPNQSRRLRPLSAVKRKPATKIRPGYRIEANLAKQAPNNSYSPPLHYEDIEFTCRDCGVMSIWTAEQQRLWYEEWGGPIQSTAVRCRACRQRVRLEKAEQKRHMQDMGKNNPAVKKKENKKANARDGARCKVIGGTHKGKSGTIRDINTSKTGFVTITVVQANGDRFKTLAKNAEMQ